MRFQHVGQCNSFQGPHKGRPENKLLPHHGTLLSKCGNHTGELVNVTPLGGRWVPDNEADECAKCYCAFSFFQRKHHCRCCGKLFCKSCSSSRVLIHQAYRANNPIREADGIQLRACDGCALRSLEIKTAPTMTWSCCQEMESSVGECKSNQYSEWSCCKNRKANSSDCTQQVWSCCPEVHDNYRIQTCKNNPQFRWSCCKEKDANLMYCSLSEAHHLVRSVGMKLNSASNESNALGLVKELDDVKVVGVTLHGELIVDGGIKGIIAPDDLVKEKAAREKAAREKAAREKAAREKAAREKAAREKAARERQREKAQRKGSKGKKKQVGRSACSRRLSNNKRSLRKH